MKDQFTITVPPEDRAIVIPPENRVIVVPPECRVLKVRKGDEMLIKSCQHTAGDTRGWTVDYSDWLDNGVHIAQIEAPSSSTTCTTNTISKQGDQIEFFLTGGLLGERLTVTPQMTDTKGNVKTDTISFTVVSP